MIERIEVTEAIAIKIGNRYFCGFGKIGQVQTAWSLAGAKLFMPTGKERIQIVTDKLNAKKKAFEMVNISVVAA